MIIPWLIITNEEKIKTSVSDHCGALITKRRKKSKPPWSSLVDWPRLINSEEKYGGKTSMKLPKELPHGESLGANGIREKINLLHGAERCVKNSGVVSYCVDLKPSAKVILIGDWSTSYRTISCLQGKRLFPFMITSVIMTAQRIETCFWDSQEKEKLKSIKNLHSTVYRTAVVIVRGITGVWMHFLSTSLSLVITRREECTRTDISHGPASLDSTFEHYGTGW